MASFLAQGRGQECCYLYFSKSPLGKCLFILRFSWIFLGAGKWEITWRSQVPSDHFCKTPQGSDWPPNPPAASRGRAGSYPGSKTLGSSWGEGCEDRGVRSHLCKWVGGQISGVCAHGQGAASPWVTTPLTPQKFDYDSSTVRKKFFREALLQITIPFLLKKLAPTCKGVRGESLGCKEGLSTHSPPACWAEPPLPTAGISQVPGADL